MTLDELRELVFNSLIEPIAHLGCAGKPTCKRPNCTSKGEHDTDIGMFDGVIEVSIDNQDFEIRVVKSRPTSFHRRDLIGDQ